MRGKVAVKGKGEMMTYTLLRQKQAPGVARTGTIKSRLEVRDMQTRMHPEIRALKECI